MLGMLAVPESERGEGGVGVSHRVSRKPYVKKDCLLTRCCVFSEPKERPASIQRRGNPMGMMPSTQQLNKERFT